MKRLFAPALLVAGLAACSREPPPPVITEIAISIDANNECALEQSPVECQQVAAIIQSKYPTSKPRVDICLDKQARYEAAVEVMNAVNAAGFPVGSFDCKRG